jgi:hypothetical protein
MRSWPVCKDPILNKEYWRHIRSHPGHENDAPPSGVCFFEFVKEPTLLVGASNIPRMLGTEQYAARTREDLSRD